MRPWNLVALTVASVALLAPAAHAQCDALPNGIAIDSYLYAEEVDSNAWYLSGYSYTSLPWNNAWGLYADANLQNRLDYASAGPSFQDYVEADVSATVYEPGDYLIVAGHQALEYCDYINYDLGYTYYDVQVQGTSGLGLPTGEHSTGSYTIGNPSRVAGVFNMYIDPFSTNYSGQVVRENAYMDDGCWFEESLYPYISGTGNSFWTVGLLNS